MPTPKPTPRAVVLDLFAGSAVEAVDVADGPAFDAEDPAEDAAIDVLADADADDDADALDVATEEAVEAWVCVYDSPMMVRVYTSAGDCAKVKLSNMELAWQLQPS